MILLDDYLFNDFFNHKNNYQMVNVFGLFD